MKRNRLISSSSAVIAIATIVTLVLSCSRTDTTNVTTPSDTSLAASGAGLDADILTSKRWTSGHRAALRVNAFRASDLMSLEELDEGEVYVAWGEGDERRELARAEVGNGGSADLTINVPDVDPGTYPILVGIQTSEGVRELTTEIEIARDVRVMLTTDKPLYQPGQTIHMRALALRSMDLRPAAESRVTFEVADGRGNKVFREDVPVNRFGVANVDFTLADQVNHGTYQIKASIGEDSVTERSVEVKRYSLPRFRVEITGTESYYQPGDRVRGTIRSEYFFGRKVDGGEVRIVASTFDVGWNELVNLEGRTSENGQFEFELQLPERFVGLPLTQNNALIRLEASVRDGAQHTERKSITIPVAREALNVELVPESAQIVPGLQNTLYAVVTYPDGTPAQAEIALRHGQDNATARSNEAGIARLELDFQPDSIGRSGADEAPGCGDSRGYIVEVEAHDERGERATSRRCLAADEPSSSPILLRLDSALYRGGQTMNIEAIAPGRGPIFLSLMKEGQMLLSSTLRREGAVARRAIDLPPDLFGTIEVHAYRVDENSQIVRDGRVVYVEPVSDLTIQIEPDQEEYRPGEEANIRFQVTDESGSGVPAALGVVVVDESVYALSDAQAGLERVFFTLERELLTPRVELHYHNHHPIDQVVLDDQREARREQAARVLLSAVEPTVGVGHLRSAAEVRETFMDEQLPRVYSAIIDYAMESSRELRSGFPSNLLSTLVVEGTLDDSDTIAPNGSRLSLVILRELDPGFTSTNVRSVARLIDDYSSGSVGSSHEHLLEDLGDGPFATLARRRMNESRSRAEQERMNDMAFAEAAMADGMGGAAPPPSPMATTTSEADDSAGSKSGGVRVRQHFPETMLWQPSLITDEQGRASLAVEMADSITTWRLSASASSSTGLLGSKTAGLRVFQDFFVDLDLPPALTQNDEVSVPVAVYNYLETSQSIELRLERDSSIELLGAERQRLTVEPGEVTVRYFRVRATTPGTARLTVHASGSRLSDAVRREVRIEPDGRPETFAMGDALTKESTLRVQIPSSAVSGSERAQLKVFGGSLAQAIDNLDSLLQMPSGCFEQTSSTTYPNVLVLQYLRDSRQSSPEVEMRALEYIGLGYQRLLTFEVDGGGFEWFGRAPAHQILTAYGLMEFSDMARVYDVDQRVIERTQQWLISQQRNDGTWLSDQQGIEEGAINAYQGDALRTTSYIAWALGMSGTTGPALERALAYIRQHRGEASDAYTQAVAANALISANPRDRDGLALIEELVRNASTNDNVTSWSDADGQGMTYSTGNAHTIETTALAVLALSKAGRHASLTQRAVAFLMRSKDSFGNWSTTQATILALRAMLAASDAGSDETAEVTITVNGQRAGGFMVTPENRDVVQAIDLSNHLRRGNNEVHLVTSADAGLFFQLTGGFHVPWGGSRPLTPADQPLSIAVSYDRTSLQVDDTVQLTATVRYQGQEPAQMPIVDLGVPPGFEVETADLGRLVESQTISRFSVTPRQVILYLDELRPGEAFTIRYRLRARFPVRVQAPSSQTYLYYTPEQRADTQPSTLVVTR